MKICEAFDRWKCALIEQDLQTTQAARHRAHARVTSMEDLIAEHPRRTSRASASSWRCTSILAASIPRRQTAFEQVLSAYKDCVRVLGCDPLAEVKSLMPACQQGV